MPETDTPVTKPPLENVLENASKNALEQPLKAYGYVLLCADNTLYTGWTLDPERRLAEHNAGGKLGAKYTRSRLPVKQVGLFSFETPQQARQWEAAFKRLSRKQKQLQLGL